MFTGTIKTEFLDDGKWKLLENITYKTDFSFVDKKRKSLLYSDYVGVIINIPKGFLTDFASTPKFLHSFFPPTDLDYILSAILHDYLYFSNYFTRLESDIIFLQAMKLQGCPWWKRKAVFNGVRIGGWKAWQKHSDALLKGGRILGEIKFL